MSVRHLSAVLRWVVIDTLDERIRAIEKKLNVCGETGKPVHAHDGVHRSITLLDGKFVAGAENSNTGDDCGPLEEFALRRYLHEVNELSEMISSDMDRCRSTAKEDDRLQNLQKALAKASELRSRVADCFAACAAAHAKGPLPKDPPAAPGRAALLRPQPTRPATGTHTRRHSSNADLFRVYGVSSLPAASRTDTAMMSAREASVVARTFVRPRLRRASGALRPALALRSAKMCAAPAVREVRAAAAAASASASAMDSGTATASAEASMPGSPRQSSEKEGNARNFCEESQRRPPTGGRARGVRCRPCSEAHPDTLFVRAQRELGDQLMQAKRYAEAVDAYSEAIGRDSTNDLLLCSRAAAYMLINQCTLALMDCECVLQRSPHNLRAHWRAARALLYVNRLQEAKRHYRIARELCVDPVEERLIVEEARAARALEMYYTHVKEGRWQDGARCATELLRVFGSTGIAGLLWRCRKMEAMLHMDPWRTLEEIKRLREGFPNYAELLFLHAKCLFYCLHDAESTKKVRELLCAACAQKEKEGGSEDSRYAHLEQTVMMFERYRDKGNSAYNNSKWGEAHAAYTRCLGIDPLNRSLVAVTYCNRSATCMQMMWWNDALMDIHRSIHISANNAKAYARRARIYLHFASNETGKDKNFLDFAVADLIRAVELSPTDENSRQLAEAMRLKADREVHSAHAKANGRDCGQPPRTEGRARSAGPQAYARPHAQRQQAPGGRKVASAHARLRHLLVLGIDGDTEPEAQVIVKAYREAALRWHPDKWVTATSTEQWTAEQKFKEINIAYQSLKESMPRY